MDVQTKSDFYKKKHIKYFKNCFYVIPTSYSSYDTSRMTIAFFVLSGLDMLNALEELNEQPKAIIDWILSLQITPNEDDTNLELCGFRGSPSVAVHDLTYDTSSIAMTYTALASLVILGDDLSRVNRKSVLAGLQRLQLPDGSFYATSSGSENDMRFVYCACCICYILDDWTGINIDAILSFIKNSLGYDGALAQGPGLESHGGSTYCAIASLVLLDALNTTLSHNQLDSIRRWCVFRQLSGFQGRPNKDADTCYSFWIGATLKMLDSFNFVNTEHNRGFLMNNQDSVTGGFSKIPNIHSDVLHTYFGICGLSLQNEPSICPMYAALNISERAYLHLKKLHSKSEINA